MIHGKDPEPKPEEGTDAGGVEQGADAGAGEQGADAGAGESQGSDHTESQGDHAD